MPRIKSYRTTEERFLNALLQCRQGDGHIPRYMAKMRVGPWCKRDQFNDLITSLAITVHERDDQWRGQYYDAAEIVDKLFALRQTLDAQDRKQLQETISDEAKAW